MIDTHTHIYTEEFDSDRTDVVDRARQAGVTGMLLPCIDGTSPERMLALCKAYPGLCHPMIGLHPTELPENGIDDTLDRMEAMLSAPEAPYIAVGEVGMDLYWDSSRRDEQMRVLDRQLQWAVRYRLPVSIHSRSAHKELMEVMLPYADRLKGGVFHCFGGTIDEARELLSSFPGFALGIGGIVTFKKSPLPAILHAAVPPDRIVLETDAPYLAPTPHRGSRNEPAYLPLVVEKLAAIYETSTDEMAARTTQTACRIFSLGTTQA